MFNFKKIGKKVLSSVLGATLAMGGFLNTQVVKAGKMELDRKKCWDPYTMLSLAGFILGEDKKDDIEKLKEEFEKELNTKFSNEEWRFFLFMSDKREWILKKENDLVVAQNGLKSQLENKLDEGEKQVYNSVREFITDKEADLGKLDSIGEIKKVEDFGDGLECKIATFVEGGTKKAIVGVSVPDNRTFENYHIEKIIGDLKDLKIEGVETNDFKNDFKNVYLVIRPEENKRASKINYDIMENLQNATVVTYRANFSGNVTISENSTLIANGAFFRSGSNVTVKNVTVKKDGKLTANGTDFFGNITVEAGGKLTADGAEFSKYVIVNSNLIANGARFIEDVTVNSNLTANGAAFWKNVTVNGNLTANGAAFCASTTNIIVEAGGNLTANGAYFNRDVTVKGNLTANGATFWEKVNVNGDKLTVDISNAEFKCGAKCTINAKDSKINLTGCDFEKITIEGTCKGLEITVGKDKVAEFCQTYKDLGLNVFESINAKDWKKFKQEEIERIERRKKEEEERLKREKEEKERNKQQEEQKQEQKEDIINNNNGNDYYDDYDYYYDNGNDYYYDNDNGNDYDNDNDNGNGNGNGNGDNKEEEGQEERRKKEEKDIINNNNGNDYYDDYDYYYDNDNDNDNGNGNGNGDNKEEEGQEERRKKEEKDIINTSDDEYDDKNNNEIEIVNTDGYINIDINNILENGNILNNIDNNVDHEIKESSVNIIKKEEGSKIKKVLKYGGISGLICLAVVAPIIAFKDKIKGMFLSKKTIETPVCKVKTPVV